eukprot:IDg7056t1
MVDPVERNAHKLSIGEVVKLFSSTWDGHKAWYGMKISRSDHASNFVEFCPVWRYLEGLYYNLYALYATSGFLPGGVEFPLHAVRTYEWRSRVLCRSNYMYSGTDCDREVSARSVYVKETVHRSRRYGMYEVIVDPSFRDAAAHGFFVWRAGSLNEHDVKTVKNSRLREMACFMARYKIPCDYHNTVSEFLTDEVLIVFYPSMSQFCGKYGRKQAACQFYLERLPSLNRWR